jgi:hypothetical protein
MSVHSCYSADDWAKMTDCKVRVDGAWKQCKSIHANVDGAWKKVWPIVTVTVSSDPVSKAYTSTYGSSSSEYYTYYYPQTLTLAVSGEDSAGYTLDTSNTIMICPVTTQDDGTKYYETSKGCEYVYSTDNTWKISGGFYPLGPTQFPAGSTIELAVITSDMNSDTMKSSDFNADVVSNLGAITIYKQSLTITTSTLELENVTTIAELGTALANAGFVATASNFPDGWVVPSTNDSSSTTYSSLTLYLRDSDGNFVASSTGAYTSIQVARGTYGTNTCGSDTTWSYVSYSANASSAISAGTYHFSLSTINAKGLGDFDITFNSGTITIKEATKFVDPFYPYFASTGNQHTTGIGLNQYNIISDLVIRKYTSSSSAGELFPEGTKFRIDQKGQGSGYTIFDLDAEGNLRNIYNNSGWTIKITGNTYMTDSAVLTAVDGGAYWWDGTKAVSSVTLTIN